MSPNLIGAPSPNKPVLVQTSFDIDIDGAILQCQRHSHREPWDVPSVGAVKNDEHRHEFLRGINGEGWRLVRYFCRVSRDRILT
jgi:hypothetical protein